jgi:hypothetical protein
LISIGDFSLLYPILPKSARPYPEKKRLQYERFTSVKKSAPIQPLGADSAVNAKHGVFTIYNTQMRFVPLMDRHRADLIGHWNHSLSSLI